MYRQVSSGLNNTAVPLMQMEKEKEDSRFDRIYLVFEESKEDKVIKIFNELIDFCDDNGHIRVS